MAKIVHFGKYYFPDAGGIESVTLSLARGAIASGHSVTVVCFGKAVSDRQDVIDGVRVIRAPIAKLIASQPLGLRYFFYCLSTSKSADLVPEVLID